MAAALTLITLTTNAHAEPSPVKRAFEAATKDLRERREEAQKALAEAETAPPR
ncbi:hypothetical protein [Nonomuraea sp. NPDC050691]|uniref:hypothetical protein n=1 Tax=Nonomuraea sp. NPDC050691 TaxID=3155661 RepID=UPI0033E3ED3B